MAEQDEEKVDVEDVEDDSDDEVPDLEDGAADGDGDLDAGDGEVRENELFALDAYSRLRSTGGKGWQAEP
jgi:hypothetical protein